jgi:hypothetical protein
MGIYGLLTSAKLQVQTSKLKESSKLQYCQRPVSDLRWLPMALELFSWSFG